MSRRTRTAREMRTILADYAEHHPDPDTAAIARSAVEAFDADDHDRGMDLARDVLRRIHKP